MNKNILKANLFTPGVNGRWGLPRLYWGPPGVGKSATIKNTIHELGMNCEVILSSIRDPSDFAGIPVPQQRGDKLVMTMAPPDWALRAAEMGRCTIFLDEIGDAAPAVQAALMQVVLEGRVGDFQLPPGVRFLAAANPPEMAANGFEMSPPLANRFGHEDVNYLPGGGTTFSRTDVDTWCDWMLGSGRSSPGVNSSASPEQVEKHVMGQWADEYSKARGQVTAFMTSAAGGPKTLFSLPDLGATASSRAWPSPRSWECATRLLASSRIHGLSDVDRDAWMESHVGTGPTAMFAAFVQDLNMPDPRQFLANGGKGWEHDPRRLDRTLALLSSCTALIIDMKRGTDQKELAKTLWEVIMPIAEKSADVCVRSVTSLIVADLSETPEATKTMGKMRKMLKACGVM